MQLGAFVLRVAPTCRMEPKLGRKVFSVTKRWHVQNGNETLFRRAKRAKRVPCQAVMKPFGAKVPCVFANGFMALFASILFIRLLSHLHRWHEFGWRIHWIPRVLFPAAIFVVVSWRHLVISLHFIISSFMIFHVSSCLRPHFTYRRYQTGLPQNVLY